MNLSEMTKITTKKTRRLGQGHGSGRVKTSGRGTKGQKARGKIPFTKYSGGSLAFVKSLPLLRGKDKNYSLQTPALPIAVSKLNNLPKGSIVDIKLLVDKKIVDAKVAKNRPVKILDGGDLSVALTVKLPVSAKAKAKIEKVGGSVQV